MENVIVEVAGRDSAAAILKYCEENSSIRVLPTYVRAPTEYGDFTEIEQTVFRLAGTLKKRFNVEVEQLVVSEDPLLWQAINGRYMSLLYREFGFYTPCIGCHLYMHILRAPLAVQSGCSKIIAGERENHGGSIKLNQTAKVLDAYLEVMRSVGVELLLPVRKIRRNSDIERIVEEDWKASEKQMHCVLSGNYREVAPSKESLNRYLVQFLIPVGKRLLPAVLNRKGGYLEIVSEVLGR